ncbi:MAG: hypothetical protein NTY01_03040 [Verrucomicrobia bacterium]|nr:hypothetical protein [Verrucomicrobiota bacterium]
MAAFLRSETIQQSVTRLVASKAQRGFTDFLVLKRALTRAGQASVPFSMKDPHFTGAIQELVGTRQNQGTSSRDKDRLPPFFKVFGTAQPVSKKMLTNGPADTLSGPAWQPLVRLEGQRPRRGSLRSGHEGHLEDLLLKREGQKPMLTDAAIWFFRESDLLSKGVAMTGSGKSLRQALERAFVAELSLNQKEVSVLFGSGSLPLDSVTVSELVQPQPASPEDFLPLGDVTTAEQADWTEVAAAFEKDASSKEVGLQTNGSQAVRFATSLLAKRFLVQTGLAGSGKTKLAQAFSRWITPKSEQGGRANPHYAMVPVGADWTGNENVLGYPDGLDSTRYVTKPALELILHARDHSEAPHFLILDEMNLSHVERYFADLLSAMESGEPVPLYAGDIEKPETWREAPGVGRVPPRFELPSNLFVVGTVNVDETTYMFSPKVLDRANVIEFRVNDDELGTFLSEPKPVKLGALDGLGKNFGAAFVAHARDVLPGTDKLVTVPASARPQFEAEMLLFFKLLREHGAEYGFRVAHDAARFTYFYKLLGDYPDDDMTWFDEAFDCVVFQKLLPKLHGSRARLGPLLKKLWHACIAPHGERRPEALKNLEDKAKQTGAAAEPSRNVPADARYPLSAEKIGRMWRQLADNGFASFAEA